MGLNNVRFLPRQPTKAMGQFYGIVDALLVHLFDDPALRITIPSKIQTYLYMGKPIVIAMEGDAVDLVEQPGAGLICKPMDAVALGMLDYECLSIKELIGTGKSQITFNMVPIEDAYPYASEDVDVTFQLWDLLEPKLKESNLRKLYDEVEMPLVRVLASMRLNGIKVDPKELQMQKVEILKHLVGGSAGPAAAETQLALEEYASG